MIRTRQLTRSSRTLGRAAGSSRRRLWLQNLEDRLAPAALVVTSSADAGPGSLRDTLVVANGNGEADTITFSGVTAVALSTGELTISEAGQGLVIDGAGAVTLTASAGARLFNLTATGKPVIGLTGLTLSGGSVTGNGGAIFMTDQQLTLTNVTLSGNKAAAGGAISTSGTVAGASITISGSTISGNTAITSAGGALHAASAATITVANSTFNLNSAAGNGGAVNGASSLNLTTSSTTFSNHRTNASGGAIFLNAASTVAFNAGSVFTANTATSAGGAIGALTTATIALTMTSAAFTSNSAGTTGGAINVGKLDAGANTIGASSFTSNKANSTGGAINFASATTVTINAGSFLNNTATSSGGAISTASSTTTLTVANSAFTGNSSGSNGGAINHTGAAVVTQTGNAFTNNRSNAAGGAVHGAASLSFTATSTTFSGNTAGGTGGGVNAASSVTLNVSDSAFTGNRATTGGALRFANVAATAVAVTNSTITGNITTSSGGGGIYATVGTLTVSGSTVANNTSAAGGGGIVVSGAGSATITNTTISGNVAQSANGGGGIRMAAGGNNLVIRNSTIANNSVAAAGGKGGGIAFVGAPASIEIDSTIIAGNSATLQPDLGQITTGVVFALPFSTQNIFGGIDTATFNLDPGNQFGDETAPINAGLLPLGNYGGNGMPVHGLKVGSIALNAGSNELALPTDQIGNPRPVNPADTDVGAVEGATAIPFVVSSGPLVNINAGNAAGNATYTVAVVYQADNVGGLDTTTVDGNDIAVSVPAGVAAIGAVSVTVTKTAGNQWTANYTFTAPGGSWDFTDGGTYGVALNPNQVKDSNGSAVPADSLGSFTVGFLKSYLVDNPADAVDGDFSPGNLTLREAVQLANANQGTADTIAFAPSLAGATISLLTGELPIADAVTVDATGVSGLTVSGAAAAAANNRVFNINIPFTFAQTVTIRSLTLAGGNVSTVGGGAVLVSDESVSFTNVTFSGNKATGTGGAVSIALTGASVAFTNAAFENNSASGNGGAIASAGTVTVTIANSQFNANTSAAQGGAIQAGSGLTLTVTNSSFTGNTAATGGGGANVGLGDVSFGSSSFTNNRSGSVGGALSFPSAGTTTVTLTGATFSNNTAATTGGAISLGGASQTLNVSSSVFTANSATTASSGTGGAINVSGASSSVTINASTFTSNIGASSVSTSGGGAIFASVATSLTINNATFAGNSATASHGGAIAASTSITLTVDSTTFVNNSAKATGGAIRLANAASSLLLNQSTLSGNTAVTSGGAIYFAAGGQLAVTASTIDTNVAGNGGAIRTGAATINLTNSTVADNKATAAAGGGGLRVVGDALLTIQNSAVAGNAATAGKGGGLYFTGSGGQIILDSTIIASNSASLAGRDVFSSAGGYLILGSQNLVGALDPSMVLFDPNNQSGVDTAPLNPGLFALANNGGLTRTMGLTYTSPALNKGSNPLFLPTDQRGAPRPPVSADNDVGAFEGTLPLPFVAGAGPIAPITSVSSAPVTVTVIYDDETGINTASLGADDLVITSPQPLGPVAFIGFAVSGKQVTATYQIPAPGGSWDAIDSGAYVISVAAGKVLDLDVSANGILASAVGTLNVGIAGALVVDSTSDLADGNYGPGQFSLREAAAAANNAAGGASTISFAPSVFGTAQTITLTPAHGGEILVSASVVINGPGAGLLTVSGGGTNRIFNVTDGAAAVLNVAISGLTLANGTVTGNGGAIALGGESLTLTNVALVANTVTGLGGAIAITAAGSTISLSASTLANNSASSNGGAIGTPAGGSNTITIAGSTVTGNKSAGNGGVLDSGGGGGVITVIASTLSGNVATSNGGVFSGGYPSVAAFIDSTLSGNTAKNGGALSVYATSLRVVNSTIVGNTATTNGGAMTQNRAASAIAKIEVVNSTVVGNSAGTRGGGINMSSTVASGPTITIFGSVVSGNTAPTGPDVFRAATAPNNTADVNFSAVGASAGFTLSGTSGNNLAFGAPLLLGPLQNNGGPTQTLAPLPGSPLIDAGNQPTPSLTFDQRGLARTFDDPLAINAGDGTDIGAVESQPVATPSKVTGVVINNGATQRSRVTTLKVTFDNPVTVASPAAAFSLVRVGDGAPVTLNTVIDGSGTFATITFTGGAIDGANPVVSLADGRYTLTAVASAFGGGGLDGDGNGTAGDNFLFASTPFVNVGTPATGIFRLFGDNNGNGQIGTDDFLSFRLAFLSNNDAFDNDGNGTVDAGDFLKFRLNFLAQIA